MKRLYLIWLALTASAITVEHEISTIKTAGNVQFINDVKDDLEYISQHHYSLNGITIAHSADKIDSSAIQRFLGRAPSVIRRLIEILEPLEVTEKDAS